MPTYIERAREQCEACGGIVQVDTNAAGDVTRSHVGSCSPGGAVASAPPPEGEAP